MKRITEGVARDGGALGASVQFMDRNTTIGWGRVLCLLRLKVWRVKGCLVGWWWSSGGWSGRRGNTSLRGARARAFLVRVNYIGTGT